MNNILKRIVAFFIDVFVVMLISSSLSMISFLNPDYDKYNKVINEEMEVLDDYKNKKIDIDEYVDKVGELSYEAEKYNVYTNVIIIVVYLLYFVGFNYITKGQTLGKRIFKLRVVDNSDKKSNPNIGKYFIRSLVLYGLVFEILLLIFINILDKDSYIRVNEIISYCQSLVYFVTVVMVAVRLDSRGLHDILAGTIVVDGTKLLEEEEENDKAKDKVIDVEYEEIKKRRKDKEIED